MNKVSLVNKIETPPEYGSKLVLDFINNPISQTILLGNILQSKFSQFLQRDYDIGAVEWRMMIVLAAQPNSTMSQVTDAINMDKAAVSRALGKLDEKRLASSKAVSTNARSKTWRLTPAGVALHDAILKKVMVYIDELLKDIPEESLIIMSEAMKQMKQNALAADW